MIEEGGGGWGDVGGGRGDERGEGVGEEGDEGGGSGRRKEEVDGGKGGGNEASKQVSIHSMNHYLCAAKLKWPLPTNQAAPRHGDTAPKHCCVPIKHDGSIHIHTRPQQGYPTPTVVDKRVVTLERNEDSVGGN